MQLRDPWALSASPGSAAGAWVTECPQTPFNALVSGGADFHLVRGGRGVSHTALLAWSPGPWAQSENGGLTSDGAPGTFGVAWGQFRSPLLGGAPSSGGGQACCSACCSAQDSPPPQAGASPRVSRD